MPRNDSKAELNARLIHKRLRRSLPLTKPEICRELGISYTDFEQAVSFSRRCTDSSVLANEIVCVTKADPFVYFLAKNYEQANTYTTQRAKIASGHVISVEALLKKEMDKYPEKAREIGLCLRTIERVREDIATLLS